ncbi:hypothetical protein L7F22_035537 [Adiantum nelumboides]|nr:hypothetical protein [Adiantum nelumboides]
MEIRQALNAHDGDTRKTVVLYIGKLKFELQAFKDEDSFCIADLDGKDVIHRMPWNHKVDSVIHSMKKKVKFKYKDKKKFKDFQPHRFEKWLPSNQRHSNGLWKIQDNPKWPDLHDVHDVQSFLRLCSYYRRFIKHFARIASPLHDLTKKKTPFQWKEKAEATFRELKMALTSGPVLIIPDFAKPFVVKANACGDCIGAILNQESHAVAFES